MSFILTTTGATSSVTFNDLGERTIVHPTNDLDLTLEYSNDQITSSIELQSAINSGYVTLVDSLGRDVSNLNIAQVGPQGVNGPQGASGPQGPFSDSHYHVHDATGGLNYTNSWVDIPIGTTALSNSKFSLISSTEVEINEAGTYTVIGRHSCRGSVSNSRSQVITRMMINTGGGYTEAPGTRGEIYARQSNFGGTSMMTFSHAFNVGDSVKIQAMRSVGGTTLVSIANGSNIVIF